MTIAAFILGGALAWLHFEVWGPTIAPGLRVWVAWMGLVTLALIWQSWRARDNAAMVAGVILLMSYVAANFTWSVYQEVKHIADVTALQAHAARNLVVAVLLFLLAITYWRALFLIAGVLYLSLIFIAVAVDQKVILDWPRSPTFLAWSYPDIAAGLQHAALLVISFGVRKREGVDLGRDYRSGDNSGALGFARVAVHPKREDGAEA